MEKEKELKQRISQGGECQEKCSVYNNLKASAYEERMVYINALLGEIGEDFLIEQPFMCYRGDNIFIGNHFFANEQLVIEAAEKVTIGDHVFIGPDCKIYTAIQQENIKEQDKDFKGAKPVTIGSRVWIGGGVTIMPGVTIGDDAVIGSGSVVIEDIPTNKLASGNPCKVLRDKD